MVMTKRQPVVASACCTHFQWKFSMSGQALLLSAKLANDHPMHVLILSVN